MNELHIVEVAAVLRQLTAQLVGSDDLDDALARLAATTADLVDVPSWCGVTLVRAGGPGTAAASPDLPPDLDESQYRTGDGPSMQAIRTRELVLSADLAAERRWPAWLPLARGKGVRGALAVPIDIDEHVIGALTLYAGAPHRFTPEVGLTAMLVAEHAGLLLAGVLDRGRLTGLTEELTEALGAGEAVNRAIGIVMAQRSCSARVALDVLREAADRLRTPLPAVAARLVDSIASRSP